MVRWPKAFLIMAGLVYSDCRDADGKPREVKSTHRAELDKSRFLRWVAPMIFAGAVPRDGADRTMVFPQTHANMAAMMGYTWTESYTRNAGKAPRLAQRATARSLVKGAVYKFAFDEGAARYKDTDDYSMPTVSELRKNEEWKVYWREVRAEYAGYVQVPAWILDPRTPGTPYEKLVLIALASFNLFKLDANGYCAGEIQEQLQTIGARVGLGKDAVRCALATYQALGLLQVKHYPPRLEINGQQVREGTAGAKRRQPPNTIYYVAGREFDEDKAAREMERFLTAAKPIRDNAWFDVAAELHVATMREWAGTRQLESTLRGECRKRLQLAGVPGHMISTLFPAIPKKPPG
jgi:hypothetical protein